MDPPPTSSLVNVAERDGGGQPPQLVAAGLAVVRAERDRSLHACAQRHAQRALPECAAQREPGRKPFGLMAEVKSVGCRMRLERGKWLGRVWIGEFS